MDISPNLGVVSHPGRIVHEEVIPERQSWSRIIRSGEILRITDLHGQQAVDFLCYDAHDLDDRYSATNTVKVQGNVFIGEGTVLYSDSGASLLTISRDTLGRHDTLYGCCSNPNNLLRYGVHTIESCYTNFAGELAKHGLDRRAIVSNVNFFMQVPISPDGAAGVADGVSAPGNFVELRAERDVLVVLSNCPQMHNPCNGFNPTPIQVVVYA